MAEKEKISVRFNNWFFKGRIDKKNKETEKISKLSKEYDAGNILKVGKI